MINDVVLPSSDELQRFAQLRADLFDAIAFELHTGGYGKSYEGTFSLAFPNYWESRDEQPKFRIELSCYAVGPNRHHSWTGGSWRAVLNMCEDDVRTWISETYAFMDEDDCEDRNA
jgi:hypothetical protein